MNAHTPGPWAMHSPTEGNPKTGDGSYCITAALDGDEESTGVIANIMPQDWHETPANARLIAAAPDLLAIVEFLHEWVEQGSDVVHLGALFGDDDYGDPARVKPDLPVTLRQAIRDAIAAATGKE